MTQRTNTRTMITTMFGACVMGTSTQPVMVMFMQFMVLMQRVLLPNSRAERGLSFYALLQSKESTENDNKKMNGYLPMANDDTHRFLSFCEYLCVTFEVPTINISYKEITSWPECFYVLSTYEYRMSQTKENSTVHVV